MKQFLYILALAFPYSYQYICNNYSINNIRFTISITCHISFQMSFQLTDILVLLMSHNNMHNNVHLVELFISSCNYCSYKVIWKCRNQFKNPYFFSVNDVFFFMLTMEVNMMEHVEKHSCLTLNLLVLEWAKSEITKILNTEGNSKNGKSLIKLQIHQQLRYMYIKQMDNSFHSFYLVQSFS